MSERDVETEVYERLYGLSHREQPGNGTSRGRVLIGDGDLPAAVETDGIDRALPPIRRATLASPWLAALGREAATLAAHGIGRLISVTRSGEGLALTGASRGRETLRRARPALAATPARPRHGLDEAQPAVERSAAALPGRRVVALAVLAAALIAVSLLAVLLSSGGTTRLAHTRVVASPPRAAPAWRAELTPRPRRHHSAPPLVSPAPSSASLPANTVRATTRSRRHSPPHRLVRRRPTRRTARTHPPAQRPPPIRRQPSQEGPVPPTPTEPPAAPTPTGTGGTATGGTSAQPGTAG